MTTTHTPGQLQVPEPYDGQFAVIAETEGRPYAVAVSIRNPADARRLAACWNVCQGFDTELLEHIVLLGETMQSRFKARDNVEEVLIADRLRFMKERDALQATLTSIMEAVGRKQMADFIEKFGAPPPDTTITTNNVCGKPGTTCKWVETKPYGSKCTTCGETIPF